MLTPPRDLQEQRIIQILRRAYSGYSIRIVERPQWTAAKFALKGGGGACVNVSKLARELERGRSLPLIEADMQSWSH